MLMSNTAGTLSTLSNCHVHVLHMHACSSAPCCTMSYLHLPPLHNVPTCIHDTANIVCVYLLCFLLLAAFLQGMFLLLVTNRGSNILEDLDTLRLLSKLVPEYAGSMLDEEAISRAAFDLIFAFDEVISHGHKENITVQQVRAGVLRELWW
jgi:hypothetical protein